MSTITENTVAAHRDAIAEKLRRIADILEDEELCAEAIVAEVGELLNDYRKEA